MINKHQPTDELAIVESLRGICEKSRVAIAHEWVANWAGSEKTFRELAHLLPNADLYTLTMNPRMAQEFLRRPIQTSFLDRRIVRDARWATLPFMGHAWRNISNQAYDIVLTSTHAFAREFGPARDALHLCYCYTPARYVWWPELDRRGRVLGGRLRDTFRRLDLQSVDSVDSFACISSAVKDRIAQIYRREARVIPPPVNTEFYNIAEDLHRDDYVLAYSRFVPYKSLHIAIAAAAKARKRIIVAGSGPCERQLRATAMKVGADASFVIAPSDHQLRLLIQRAQAVIFCANEDFGIVPVEAQACGTPVAALAVGGALDTVIPGVTGEFASDATADAFADAIHRVLSLTVDPEILRENARRFSTQQFRRRVANWILTTSEQSNCN